MIQRLIVGVLVMAAAIYVVRRVYREWKLKMEGCVNCAIKVAAKSSPGSRG